MFRSKRYKYCMQFLLEVFIEFIEIFIYANVLHATFMAFAFRAQGYRVKIFFIFYLASSHLSV